MHKEYKKFCSMIFNQEVSDMELIYDKSEVPKILDINRDQLSLKYEAAMCTLNDFPYAHK